MRKVLFFALFLGGVFFSLNVQAQLAACPSGPGWVANTGMSATISGSSTGLPFSITAVANNNAYNGFGVSCALASTGTNMNGSVTASITGGSSPFTYNLTGAASQSNTGVAGTTNTFSGLFGANTNSAANAYSVNAVDVNGCTAAMSGNVNVTAPPDLIAGTCMTADLCQTNSAQVQVSAAGGVSSVSGYDVAWSSVANSPFAGPPAAGLGGPSAPGTNPSPYLNAIATSGGAILVTGLSGNSTYSFVVTDDNGCIVQ